MHTSLIQHIPLITDMSAYTVIPFSNALPPCVVLPMHSRATRLEEKNPVKVTCIYLNKLDNMISKQYHPNQH